MEETPRDAGLPPRLDADRAWAPRGPESVGHTQDTLPGEHAWKPFHRKAALLRATGATWPEVAAALGRGHSTVARYQSLPGWNSLVSRELGAECAEFMEQHTGPILARLAEMALDKGDTKAGVKAALGFMALAVKHAAQAAGTYRPPGFASGAGNPSVSGGAGGAPPSGGGVELSLTIVGVQGAPASSCAGAAGGAGAAGAPPPGDAGTDPA